MTTETTSGQWLDIQALAQHLNCSASSIRRWVRLGQFPRPARLGRRVLRWRRTDIEQWLSEQGTEDHGL